ncbi:hypothetical protein Sango_0074600 [Sesamum angolense]|uniref:Transmembrane protein n=1 Tax=Sesamum angolense TaxID=2727404 RepID=A0AAE2C5R3_9LAMI|nr:hypothetical protein Sango_0074600 [Sesamum angolense]
MREEDEQTRGLQELRSMIFHILRSPPLPISFPTFSLLSSWSSQRQQISPAAFGLLFTGISIALMLFGIVTFLIGFVLMPLVFMLVLLFYFAGIVSKLLEIGRTIFCWPLSDCNKVAPGQVRGKMSPDWGPVVVAVALFILLSPGLLFQLPARARVVEFGNMYTSGISILVHAVLYFCIYTILIVAIGVHIHAAA